MTALSYGEQGGDNMDLEWQAGQNVPAAVIFVAELADHLEAGDGRPVHPQGGVGADNGLDAGEHGERLVPGGFGGGVTGPGFGHTPNVELFEHGRVAQVVEGLAEVDGVVLVVLPFAVETDIDGLGPHGVVGGDRPVVDPDRVGERG